MEPAPDDLDAPDAPPRRAMLRPGLRATRRDDTTLQVGLDPAGRVVLPDLPPVRALLSALLVGNEPDLSTPPARQSWARLIAAGLLVDRQCVTAALARAKDVRQRAAVTAAYAAHGADATRRLRTRAEARVTVRLPLRNPRAPDWGETVHRLLRGSGLGLAPPGDDFGATAALVVTDSEPAREDLDTPLRTGEPHLLLATIEGRVRLGPFVVPGRTACLRCVDAHLEELDYRRSLVVRQYADAETADADVPVPDDPALMTMALAWAARDLVAFVDGDRPSTWSATVAVEAGLGLHRQDWQRHPHCGCCWGDLLDVV